MNAVDTKITTVEETHNWWEPELWSYVYSSDGVSCPMYNHCNSRCREWLCACDNMERLKQLMDAEEFSPCDYDFAEYVAHCRMLKLTEMLANRYLNKGKIHCPAVPTELVSLFDEQKPIEVRLVSLRNHHGATWHLKDSWIIHLNANDTPAVRRFTLFHEAFHILILYRGTSTFLGRGFNRGSFTELMSECFSARILMPVNWVREKWLETHDLGTMAKIFDVPKVEMYLRLKFLRLI